jgi:hypothetical protein
MSYSRYAVSSDGAESHRKFIERITECEIDLVPHKGLTNGGELTRSAIKGAAIGPLMPPTYDAASH